MSLEDMPKPKAEYCDDPRCYHSKTEPVETERRAAAVSRSRSSSGYATESECEKQMAMAWRSIPQVFKEVADKASFDMGWRLAWLKSEESHTDTNSPTPGQTPEATTRSEESGGR